MILELRLKKELRLKTQSTEDNFCFDCMHFSTISTCTSNPISPLTHVYHANLSCLIFAFRDIHGIEIYIYNSVFVFTCILHISLEISALMALNLV